MKNFSTPPKNLFNTYGVTLNSYGLFYFLDKFR